VPSERMAEPGRLSWSARIVFTVVAVAAFVLGVVGFGKYLTNNPEYGRDPLDLVYYSLQLFVLDAAPLQNATHLPVTLQIARFAAPAVTIYLIFLAVQALLAQRLVQARIRLTRGHSILCGPQDTVGQLAKQIRRETGGRTVIVSSQRSALGRGQLHVVGDPRQRQVLERAGLERARELIAVGPDSVLNAEVAIAVHAVTARNRPLSSAMRRHKTASYSKRSWGRRSNPGR
jgi:TrkA-N domain